MFRLFLSLRLLFAIGGVIFLILVPVFFTVPFIIYMGTLVLLWTIICLSLNLIFGYAGQLSLAHGGLFGIGAYTYAILATKLGMNFWLAFPIGGLVAGILGFLIGVPSLRLRGPYFAIVTIGFNIILVAVIDALEGLTGGVYGLRGIPIPSTIYGPFFTVNFESKISQYYLVLFFLLLFWLVMYLVRNSQAGRCLIAVKKDEELCKSVGINTMGIKIQCFVLSSILAGLGGVLYASYIGVITAYDASFHIGFSALVYLTVGGVGTIAGTIVGPLIMITISELLQAMVEVRQLVNGLVLVVLIIYMPRGVVGEIVYLWKRYLLPRIEVKNIKDKMNGTSY